MGKAQKKQVVSREAWRQLCNEKLSSGQVSRTGPSSSFIVLETSREFGVEFFHTMGQVVLEVGVVGKRKTKSVMWCADHNHA